MCPHFTVQFLAPFYPGSRDQFILQSLDLPVHPCSMHILPSCPIITMPGHVTLHLRCLAALGFCLLSEGCNRPVVRCDNTNNNSYTHDYPCHIHVNLSIG